MSNLAAVPDYPEMKTELEALVPRRFSYIHADYAMTTDQKVAARFRDTGFQVGQYVRDSVTGLVEWEIKVRAKPIPSPEARTVMKDTEPTGGPVTVQGSGAYDRD